MLYRLARESRRFSVQRLRRSNVNFAVSRQTVNRRLVARAYRARRMVKVLRLTVRAKLVRRHWTQKHINRPLGQWQHRMYWAPYRPDMNSIEHIWDEIGRGLEELDPQSVNLRQLGVVVQNLRQQIPLERVQTLVSSMPCIVRALVDPRGSSMRYWIYVIHICVQISCCWTYDL